MSVLSFGHPELTENLPPSWVICVSPVNMCTGIQVGSYTCVQVFRRTVIHVQRYTGVHLNKCTVIQVLSYTSVQVHRCPCIHVLIYSGVQGGRRGKKDQGGMSPYARKMDYELQIVGNGSALCSLLTLAQSPIQLSAGATKY